MLDIPTDDVMLRQELDRLVRRWRRLARDARKKTGDDVTRPQAFYKGEWLALDRCASELKHATRARP